jgi:hypothetical protein
MSDDSFRYNAEHLDGMLRAERDRVVIALRALADRLEAASLDRVSQGLGWIAMAAEQLVQTVDRLRRGQ